MVFTPNTLHYLLEGTLLKECKKPMPTYRKNGRIIGDLWAISEKQKSIYSELSGIHYILVGCCFRFFIDLYPKNFRFDKAIEVN